MGYKDDVRKKLYKSYFTRMHASEKDFKHTSNRILNQRMIEKFRKYGKHNILDAGCGDGLFIEQCIASGLRCEGFDSNHELLLVCKKKGLAVKFADLDKRLPYKDNSFDG